MSSLKIVCRSAVLAACPVIAAVALLLTAGCSDDSTPTWPGDTFTEGLTFELIVNGAWSSDPEDSLGRTQGQIRVTVANRTQIWLGSDTMENISDSLSADRYQATVRFRDLEPGAVTVRVAFQHYDSDTDRQIVVTLDEVSTFGGNPIEIEDGAITDIGTIEVSVPQS